MTTNRYDLANAVRILSMDAVQKAHSGHPGMPMGMAEIATVLWLNFLKHDPAHPDWPNRDRFVLSNGHGSMLLYSLLYLSGYRLKIDDIKEFRQFGSCTPGHPEYGCTPGVETTTGPLGQGLGNAVGMALGERLLADKYNRHGHELFNYYTYVFVGDGCLMEGISQEVCSLAGTLSLGKLIVFYDCNGISIDGQVSGWFTENVAMRFNAMGWQVIPDVDGHDAEQIEQAIKAAREESSMPSLICCNTVIGRGAPKKQGTSAVHGMPLGEDEVRAARENLDWSLPPFTIPKEYLERWDARKKGKEHYDAWRQKIKKYQKSHQKKACELKRRLKGDAPDNFGAVIESLLAHSLREKCAMPTRKALKVCLDATGPILPELIGGSADLSDSNNTRWSECDTICPENISGNYLHFGVREFGMFAMLNGLALTGGFLPYGGTFLVFSDYCRNALRLAAMMKLRLMAVFTHDSIGVGEDGPTHQPIEHLSSLRLIPDLDVWRPGDLIETIVAFREIAMADHTGALILSRQKLEYIEREEEQVELIARGGYILHEPDGGNPDAIILATGSEVALAVAAAGLLAEKGHAIRVVSLPCCEVFMRQEESYREQVLPAHISARVAVEAGSGDYWYRWVGSNGKVLSIDCFGASAPGQQLMEHFGFTADNLAELVSSVLS